MRLIPGSICALVLLALGAATTTASAYDLFATSFFSPVDGDPDPGLTGVLKIDTVTGSTTTFIPESVGGLTLPTDVVYDPGSNTLYVSTQDGRIWHFDASNGGPRAGLVANQPVGVFAQLPTAGSGDAVNSLLIDDDEILAATAFGSISRFDLGAGAQQSDLITGLAFPSGLSKTPTGEILASIGDPFGGPGGVVSVSGGSATTLVDFTDTPGVFGASNPTVVLPVADYDSDGEVTADDYTTWSTLYATGNPIADGNFDGAIDAADYTLWRDSLGEEARILVTDLFGNQLIGFDLDGSNGSQLAVIPPDLPDPLPPNVGPSNSPSEVMLSPDGTLLVSTLGLTRRPDNRGALLEFDRDGNFLRTIADGLPGLSGIAMAPAAASLAVPEPTSIVLLGLVGACLGGRSRL